MSNQHITYNLLLFKKLKEKAVLMRHYTFCIKQQNAIQTIHLNPNECINCEHFVTNYGDCDPL